MIVNTTRKDLFYNWLLWLDPVFKLKETERKILSGYLSLHYYHRHRYSDQSILNEQLFSEDTTVQLKQKYRITDQKFNAAFNKLRGKGFFQAYQVKQGEGITKELLSLNPAITKYPKNEKFEVNIQFKIV